MKLLPPEYYLEHFRYVLHEVVGRYSPILTKQDLDFLKCIESLSLPALKLYVRLANRKGPYFRISKISYPEIACIISAVHELETHRLMEYCRNSSLVSHSFGRVYACYTHLELTDALKPYAPKRFTCKAHLVEWLGLWESHTDWLNELLKREPLIQFSKNHQWPFFCFLFFGELTPNLSDFVTDELGHIIREKPDTLQLKPYFGSRKEAEDCYSLSIIYQTFRELRGTRTAAEIVQWWQNLNIAKSGLHAKAHPIFDRLVVKLGRKLERESEYDKAVTLYFSSSVSATRERLAKLLIKTGKPEHALEICKEMLASPEHGEESYAARQLLNRLERRSRQSEARQLLKSSDILTLERMNDHVEAQALAYFQQKGWQGIHSENWIWNGFFGLLFWDIIYDPAYGSFHHPLQIAPADLYTSGFYLKRGNAIGARLKLLTDKDATLTLLQKHYDTKHGIANPFVSWHGGLIPLIEIMLDRIPVSGLASIFHTFARDVKRHRRGFPDLFLWTDNNYDFVEIKSPTDQLSPQQMHWIETFKQHGINIRVQRIAWNVETETTCI